MFSKKEKHLETAIAILTSLAGLAKENSDQALATELILEAKKYNNQLAILRKI